MANIDILKEREEDIVNFGALEYGNRQMASILEVSEKQVTTWMNDKNSAFFLLYRKGKDMCEYVIDMKLFELAKTGDLKALDKLETRKRLR